MRLVGRLRSIKAAPIDERLIAVATGNEALTPKEAVKIGLAIGVLEREVERVKQIRQALTDTPSIIDARSQVL